MTECWHEVPSLAPYEAAARIGSLGYFCLRTGTLRD